MNVVLLHLRYLSHARTGVLRALFRYIRGFVSEVLISHLISPSTPWLGFDFDGYRTGLCGDF